jgi:hypothetical protein
MPQPPNFTLAIYAIIVSYLAEWKEERKRQLDSYHPMKQ